MTHARPDAAPTPEHDTVMMGEPVGAVVLVRAAIAPLHAEPRVSSPQVSQRLAGHALHVQRTDGDWMLVRGADDYEGWVHRGYIDHASSGAVGGARRRLLSLGCATRDASAGVARALPLGAWLRDDEHVTSGAAVDEGERERLFPREASAIATTAAERFSGTPYQWGGVTPWGADCSGLVQTVFWLHGMTLPRDAWQQAQLGGDAGSDLAMLEPADLLFFSERADHRITHVGIALGGARMVHLALGRGGYAVDRLDATGDAYVTALVGRFVTARRVV